MVLGESGRIIHRTLSQSSQSSQSMKGQSRRKLNIDRIYAVIGDCGPQQLKYCLLIFFGQLQAACQMVHNVIVGQKVEFFCQQTDGIKSVGVSASYNPLSVCSERCDSFVYVGGWKTIVEEWNLVCENAYKVSMVQSALMGGVLIGAVGWGIVADRIGRRTSVLLTTGLIAGATFLSALATNFETYMLLRFVVGVGLAGHGITTFVLANELLGANKRGWFALMISAFFAIGICFLAILAIFFTDWRQLAIVTSLLSLVTALLYVKLPESPRWLLAQRNVLDARRVLAAIARGNGVEYDDGSNNDNDDLEALLNDQSNGDEDSPTTHVTQQRTETLLDLFQHKLLAVWVLIQIFSWFANSMAYYGLTMAAGNLYPNLYASVIFSGMAELPAYAILLWMQERVGRKALICASMIIGGVASSSIILIDGSDSWSNVRVLLALIGKMGISASFAVVWLHSAELFPTPMRNAGMGICSMAARVGGVLAPFVTFVGDVYPKLELVIFGLVAIAAGLLNTCLPETKQKALPECVDDMRRLRDS